MSKKNERAPPFVLFLYYAGKDICRLSQKSTQTDNFHPFVYKRICFFTNASKYAEFSPTYLIKKLYSQYFQLNLQLTNGLPLQYT